MKTTKCFLAAAICISAISFTFFGCSSDSDDSDNPAGSGVSSSSEAISSSSSGGSSGSSSSSAEEASSSSVEGGYETVPINGQVWLKKNLNVPHNEGNGESWCYEGNDYSTGEEVEITAEESCAKYGRLYN
jgi:hypothetical protein